MKTIEQLVDWDEPFFRLYKKSYEPYSNQIRKLNEDYGRIIREFGFLRNRDAMKNEVAPDFAIAATWSLEILDKKRTIARNLGTFRDWQRKLEEGPLSAEDAHNMAIDAHRRLYEFDFLRTGEAGEALEFAEFFATTCLMVAAWLANAAGADLYLLYDSRKEALIQKFQIPRGRLLEFYSMEEAARVIGLEVVVRENFGNILQKGDEGTVRRAICKGNDKYLVVVQNKKTKVEAEMFKDEFCRHLKIPLEPPAGGEDAFPTFLKTFFK